MPDHLYRVQVVIPRVTGLAEDAVSNTFHFDKDEGSAGNWLSGAQNISTRLQAFYQSQSQIMSGVLGTSLIVKAYNPRDPKPQVPLFTQTHTWTHTSTALPSEVAVCLSFRAAAMSGVAAARRRGRVFIGPLAGTVATGAPSSGEVRPSPTILEPLVNAGLALVLGGAGDPRLCIYSPTTHAVSNIDDAFNDVEDVYADNSFDTVRSRGAAPNYRFTANVVG